MAEPRVSVVIGSAAFLAVVGLVGWFISRRKDERYTGRAMLLGLPGVYLAFLASVGAPKWLYIPGLTLLAASYVFQFVMRRRQASESGDKRDATPPDLDRFV